MAQQPTLKVSGNKIPEVIAVTYSVENGSDQDGNPTGARRFAGITVTRKLDGMKDIANWGRDPARTRRLDGSIEFVGEDMQVKKTLKWFKAYISSYKLSYDEKKDLATETFTIVPEDVQVGDHKYEGHWPDRA